MRGGLPQPRDKSMISFHEFVEYLATRCDLRLSNRHWRRQVDRRLIKENEDLRGKSVEDSK